VLRGDMSLIGPRPHPIRMAVGGRDYEDVVPDYHERHAVRPGITGLAQVSGYRGTTIHRGNAIARVDYDLDYIENWSPWMDVKIILKTCRQEFLLGSGH